MELFCCLSDKTLGNFFAANWKLSFFSHNNTEDHHLFGIARTLGSLPPIGHVILSRRKRRDFFCSARESWLDCSVTRDGFDIGSLSFRVGHDFSFHSITYINRPRLAIHPHFIVSQTYTLLQDSSSRHFHDDTHIHYFSGTSYFRVLRDPMNETDF